MQYFCPRPHIMILAKTPGNEAERLQELYKYELLDTVYESEFDAIVQLASKICRAPISVISLIDNDRQWFKARKGLGVPQTDRSISFCSHTILGDGLMEVKDASHDKRFFDNPLVTGDPNIRYYAGMPLVTSLGYNLGSLCVIDSKPRELDEEQVFAMKVLSAQVMKLFELRIKNKELKKLNDVQQKILAITAHDIRGPLAALKTTYEMKNDGAFSDVEVKQIEHLVPVQLESTLNMLDNLVDWSSIELSGVNNLGNPVNLHEVCNDNFKIAGVSANFKNNKLINNIDSSLEVNCNPRVVEFILRNLLGNANKFTDNGIVSVSAHNDVQNLQITVTDTGIGIDPKVQQELTKRSAVTSHMGTRDEKGSGMGLKLIYEYLSNLKGHITFSANQPQGTIVNVSIPLTGVNA